MTKLERRPRVWREGHDESLPALGEWYWLTMSAKAAQMHETDRRQLCCVTHVGSNYVELTTVFQQEWRVHLDRFDEECAPAPDAKVVIAAAINQKREQTRVLLGEVRALTARLAVSSQPITSGNETQALVVASAAPIGEYKQALVKAKDKTLPKLFEEIRHANAAMAAWMSAELIPLKAEAEALTPVIESIEARIFNVELYAGLTEQVKQVQDGAPAGIAEPIHLFQRRAYMDEECLARYEAGGMEFDDIDDFDEWLARPANFSRLLPFARCVVAFQVRRHAKEREVVTLSDYIKFKDLWELDKWTFIYLRNGEQLYRLRTGVEFDDRLFPDLDAATMETGKLWAEVWSDGNVRKLITDNQRQGLREDQKREIAEAEKELRALARTAVPADAKEAKRRTNQIDHLRWILADKKRDGDWERYELFSPASVYHDDIAAHVKKQIDAHNRVVMILQGLVDRSPVFHPHPPWRLWEADGFAAGIRLHYDQDRALSAGEAPDFASYRAKLNATLKVGSVTVGQDDFWQRREAEKENARRSWRSDHTLTRWKPYGNPGPGETATVAVAGATSCVYRWQRGRIKRQRWGPDGDLNCSIRVPHDQLFNVSAYRPGDFHQFFDDPRTRADYLEWAPFMLAAEDWLAAQQKEGKKR